VATVLQAVSLYDDVEVGPAARGVSCAISGEGAGEVPLDDTNLAVRAVRALAAHARLDAAATVQILKGIPVAGGMAGGSADAAAALVAADALWSTGLSRAELLELAAGLGSDVPFSLAGGTALGVGRGEQLSPVLGAGQLHWVFALAPFPLSTAKVYAEFDRGDPPPGRGPEGVLSALRLGDVAALGKALHNDLQPAALRLKPALRMTLDAGVEAGAAGALVCGSGPTCAFLARDHAAAVGIAAAVAGAGVARTVRTAHGPVPGARVVTEATR
jgi:4-diphosphocytidyl-2-C-methyl-D-erythritol kinase